MPDSYLDERPRVTCTRCKGHGEVAVGGTYGTTISPEHLELTECPRCYGEGEVPL